MKLVAIDILEPLPKMKTSKRFIVVGTERFTKLTKATMTTKKTTNTVGTIFINDWIASFGIPLKVLTDNHPQFTSKFFTGDL